MRSSRDPISPATRPLDNAFSPTYLTRLRERDDSLTAAEAELAGPWKIEPVPGRPGAVAILRIWEDLAVGDPPVGVLWHLETARLLSVLLQVIDREPLFHLEEQARGRRLKCEQETPKVAALGFSSSAPALRPCWCPRSGLGVACPAGRL